MDTDTADLEFRIAEAPHRYGLEVLLVRFRIGVAEVLELRGHGERADHVDVDVVRAPLRCSDAGETARSNCSVVCVASGTPEAEACALLIKTSIPENRSTTCKTACFTASSDTESLETSTGSARTSNP